MRVLRLRKRKRRRKRILCSDEIQYFMCYKKCMYIIMAEISLYLFGKPEWEMDLDKAEPEEFRRLGDSLRDRLYRAAEITEKLERNGWERSGALYDLYFYKKVKREDAEKELKELGIKEDEVHLLEEEEEIEEEEQG